MRFGQPGLTIPAVRQTQASIRPSGGGGGGDVWVSFNHFFFLMEVCITNRFRILVRSTNK